MILEHHYAVVWRVSSCPAARKRKEVLTFSEWQELKESELCQHVVILEAWDITAGKCIAN